jgi:hypothetical protein
VFLIENRLKNNFLGLKSPYPIKKKKVNNISSTSFSKGKNRKGEVYGPYLASPSEYPFL